MMEESRFSYILFFTSNHAFRAEKLLHAEAIACKLVPVPRQYSSECGVCVRIDPSASERAERLLTLAQVEIDTIRNT